MYMLRRAVLIKTRKCMDDLTTQIESLNGFHNPDFTTEIDPFSYDG